MDILFMEMGSLMNLNGDIAWPLSRFKTYPQGEKAFMDIDNTTYNDLSLFSQEEEFSIFHKLDLARTQGGRDQLLEYFNKPFAALGPILETQQIISLLLAKTDEWPLAISNGTVMVMERFYETAIDTIPQSFNLPGALAYKVFHGPDYSLVRYSIGHFADFVRGMTRLIALLGNCQFEGFDGQIVNLGLGTS